jgi:hypothetical protein
MRKSELIPYQMKNVLIKVTVISSLYHGLDFSEYAFGQWKYRYNFNGHIKVSAVQLQDDQQLREVQKMITTGLFPESFPLRTEPDRHMLKKLHSIHLLCISHHGILEPLNNRVGIVLKAFDEGWKVSSKDAIGSALLAAILDGARPLFGLSLSGNSDPKTPMIWSLKFNGGLNLNPASQHKFIASNLKKLYNLDKHFTKFSEDDPLGQLWSQKDNLVSKIVYIDHQLNSIASVEQDSAAIAKSLSPPTFLQKLDDEFDLIDWTKFFKLLQEELHQKSPFQNSLPAFQGQHVVLMNYKQFNQVRA